MVCGIHSLEFCFYFNHTYFNMPTTETSIELKVKPEFNIEDLNDLKVHEVSSMPCNISGFDENFFLALRLQKNIDTIHPNLNYSLRLSISSSSNAQEILTITPDLWPDFIEPTEIAFEIFHIFLDENGETAELIPHIKVKDDVNYLKKNVGSSLFALNNEIAKYVMTLFPKLKEVTITLIDASKNEWTKKRAENDEGFKDHDGDKIYQKVIKKNTINIYL